MTARDLLTDKEASDIKDCYEQAKEIQPVLHTLVSNGYPYGDHLTKANEQLDWLTKSMKIFDLQ